MFVHPFIEYFLTIISIDSHNSGKKELLSQLLAAQTKFQIFYDLSNLVSGRAGIWT